MSARGRLFPFDPPVVMVLEGRISAMPQVLALHVDQGLACIPDGSAASFSRPRQLANGWAEGSPRRRRRRTIMYMVERIQVEESS